MTDNVAISGGRDVPPKNRVSKTEEHIICCKKCSKHVIYVFDTLVLESVEMVYIPCTHCKERIVFELQDFPKGYGWLISDIMFPDAKPASRAAAAKYAAPKNDYRDKS